MANNTDHEARPGELYYQAQMQTLEEMYEEHMKNPDEANDPFEWLLSIEPMTETQTFYDEETGEDIETDMQIITGHKFLISWGGPSSWIQSTNNGRSFEYHYCDWFGSDYFKTGLTGKQEDEFNALVRCRLRVSHRSGESRGGD